MSKNLKVTLVRSLIGSTNNQKLCVRGLGLKKINSFRFVEGSQANKGMINRVNHLLKVEEYK